MKIYTETTISFAKKLKTLAKEILTKEAWLEVKRTRFIFKAHSYPLHIVIIESHNTLGYFDPHTYQIGINIKLMYELKEHTLKNVLRHELAHYLSYIKYGSDETAHGEFFQKTCLDYNWGTEVSKASLNIDLSAQPVGDLASEKIITRIKALLKLAQSSNEHEANLATLKANQLLLKHNLAKTNLENNEINLYTDTLITAKKRNGKMSAIYDILKHFLVAPVFIYGKGQIAIEASGSKENLELAQYVVDFLDEEMERLWKKQTHQKGLKAKNSFFLGMAKGYESKIQKTRKEFSNEDQKSLVLVENKLSDQVKYVYRSLSSSRSQGSINPHAFQNGVSEGKNLTINKAVKNTKNKFLLNWRG